MQIGQTADEAANTATKKVDFVRVIVGMIEAADRKP